MEFLTLSAGKVSCIWFRTAGVLLPIVSHPTDTATLSRPGAMKVTSDQL
jgi:hypothetical protein